VNRLLPAAIAALGVAVLSYGLLVSAPSLSGDPTATDPVAAGDPRFSPSLGDRPSPTASPLPASTAPGVLPTPGPDDPAATPSTDPTASVGPSQTAPPTDAPTGVASRIRIPSLGIDLPVVPGDLEVRGNRDFYPLCDVAMYMPEFVQPGLVGTTYIYAHAQRGMFLPLLNESQVNDGAAMLGAPVEVYTSDGLVHLYEITRVKRHATDLSLTTVPPGEHRLVLQTSEGPTGTVPKLQLAAEPVSVVQAAPAEANPRPQPRVCLPSG
jgi:hypothetical protein